MPARKNSSIRLHESEKSWLMRHGASMPNQIREDAEVLRRLGRPPKFSEKEWTLFYGILSGFAFDPAHTRALPAMLAVAIQDAEQDGGISEKWDLDIEALAAKVADLHPADAWALLDAVRQWWHEQNQAYEEET